AFFFSSRRRHTRFSRDWSSDVCSSDLILEIEEGDTTKVERVNFIGNEKFSNSKLRSVIRTEESRWWKFLTSDDVYDPDRLAFDRSEERRVGKASGARWARYRQNTGSGA